jgi:hypothetical protein
MASIVDGTDSFTSHMHVRRDPSNAVSEEKRGNPIVKLLSFHDWSAVNGLSDSDASQMVEAALNHIENSSQKSSKWVGLTYDNQFI